MKKRLKKKLNTQSVKFKRKPHKCRRHLWTVVSYSPCKDNIYLRYYDVELQCWNCGKRKTVTVLSRTVEQFKKFQDNYWVFSNINRVVKY